MWYAIDRFEGQQAVLQDENGISLLVDKTLLPPDAVPGDVLTPCGGHYRHDRAETATRREKMYRLEQLLRGKSKGKDA